MNTTKRTRRKFTDQQKQEILAEAETTKAAGGEYKEILDKYSLNSSQLAKWRNELKTKEKPRRNVSKTSKRKIASKLSLDDIVKELKNLNNELMALEQRREELLSMKLSDIL